MMKDSPVIFDSEDVLPDDYPIYGDYFYVADGRVYRSGYHGITARELKAREGITELRRCNIVARNLVSSALMLSSQISQDEEDRDGH